MTGLAVVEVLRAAAESVRQDPVLAPYVLGPLDVPGVDAFRDGQVTVRGRIKTVPQRR